MGIIVKIERNNPFTHPFNFKLVIDIKYPNITQ